MIKLSDFALTKEYQIHGISCHEWHDFYTMVRWEVSMLDSGMLSVLDVPTGATAYVGASLVALAYVRPVAVKPEALPVVPDDKGEPTKFLTEEDRPVVAPAAKPLPKKRGNKFEP